MIGHIFVSKATAKQRYSICRSCENLIAPVNLCKICGCIVLAKVTLSNAYCPQQKWMPAEQDMSITNDYKDEIDK
jgi:hypothetical protein